MSVFVAEKRSISYQTMFGTGLDLMTEYGTRYTGLDAMKVSAVIACVGLRAGVFAQIPIKAYRDDPVTGTAVLSRVQPMLLTKPSATAVPAVWKTQMSFSRDVWGYAVGLIAAYDAFGYPTQVEWLPPWQVHARQTTIAGPLEWTVDGQPFDSSRLLHVPSRWVMPGNPLGISPLEHAGLVDLARKAQEFGRDYFISGAVPPYAVYSDTVLSEPQADVLAANIARKWQRRRPAIMGSGLKVEPFLVKGDDSQFLATMQQIKGDIAAVFNIAPEKVGGTSGGSSLTYANRDQNQDQFLVDCMNADFVIVEQTLSRNLPNPVYAQFNTSAFLRSDPKTRAEVDDIKIKNGSLTVDESRQHDSLPPLPVASPAPAA